MISGTAKYRENQAGSHTPAETVLMLFDGAVSFLRSAIKELEENNDIPAKAVLVEKTVIIIDYLQSCLDMEKGGMIAENLAKLYDYMMIKLTEANLKNDSKAMNEVMNLLLTIREGWGKISDSDGNGRSAINDNAEAGPERSESQGSSADSGTEAEPPAAKKIQIRI